MKRAYYVIADKNNLVHFEKLKNSLRKFDKETDIILFSDEDVKAANDPQIFYRATPYFGKAMFDSGYDEICHLDADQIITGDISDIWEGDFDAGVVWNDPSYPLQVWDIGVPYYNNGLNVFKTREFIEHWDRLCQGPHFNSYQFREQDLLNILCSDYHNYEIKQLDAGKSIYGEFAKSVWPQVTLKDGKLMMPNGEKELSVIHFGGGQGNAGKGKYELYFDPEVCEFLDGLVKA